MRRSQLTARRIKVYLVLIAFTVVIVHFLLGATLRSTSPMSKCIQQPLFTMHKENKIKKDDYGDYLDEPTTQNILDVKAIKLKNKQMQSLPLLTLFTVWNPDDVSLSYAHNSQQIENTISNWRLLKPYVEIILFTNSKNISLKAQKARWTVLPILNVRKGKPVLKNMFLTALSLSETDFYGYIDYTTLFSESLLKTLISVLETTKLRFKTMVITGRRIVVPDVEKLHATDWGELCTITQTGGVISDDPSDHYFIASRYFPWEDMKEVVVGHSGFEQWLFMVAIEKGYMIIDSSRTIMAVKQVSSKERNSVYTNYDSDVRKQTDIDYEMKQDRASIFSCAGKYTDFDVKCLTLIYNRNVDRNCKLKRL